MPLIPFRRLGATTPRFFLGSWTPRILSVRGVLCLLHAICLICAICVICLLPQRSEAQPSLSESATQKDPCLEADSLPIRSLDFHGLKNTSTRVVQRNLSHQLGAPFTCAKWQGERQRLLDLDIFADVEIETRVKDGQVALRYLFRELPPYIPFIAISKTDQDGLSLGPALASLNFLGQGIRAEFITRFGGTTEAQASLSSTQLGDWPVEYDLALLRINSFNHFGGFHEDSWRAKLDLIHQLEGRLKLLYAGEIYYLQSRDSARTQILLQPLGDMLPRLGVGLIWEGRNRRHDPRQGLYQELRVTQSGGPLGNPFGSAADYLEWLSDTRVYLPWWDRNTLHLAGLYQYRSGVIGRTIGSYDRFHAGGVNSLRGFERDAFQGKSEALFTIENRTDLIPKRTLKIWRWSAYYGLQGILGFEAASLWDHEALLERDFHTGIYSGLHILLAGMDRIRLEWGSNFAKLQLESGLGILDKADIQRFRAR